MYTQHTPWAAAARRAAVALIVTAAGLMMVAAPAAWAQDGEHPDHRDTGRFAQISEEKAAGDYFLKIGDLVGESDEGVTNENELRFDDTRGKES